LGLRDRDRLRGRGSTWLRPRMPPPSMHRMFTGSALGENDGTCGATIRGTYGTPEAGRCTAYEQ
jgi:hypothetical protein